MALDLQAPIAMALVAACFGYLAWTLLPAAARHALAARLPRFRGPANRTQVPHAVDRASPGCACCAGCDDALPVRGRDDSAVVKLTRSLSDRPPPVSR